MQILSLRERFTCAVLDPSIEEELHAYFQGRKILYQDIENNDVMHNREAVLSAQKKIGPALYSENFSDPEQAHFILFAGNEIIGSAELTINGETSVFQSAHVSSAFWGNHLADLLYEAREKYLQKNTEVNKVFLQVTVDNLASQKAALRNGYKAFKYDKNDLITFEKVIF